MPVNSARGGYRLPGAYAFALEVERRHAVERHPAVDPRVLVDASAEQRQRAWAKARAEPRRSKLLDQLDSGQVVEVDRIHLPLGSRSLPTPPSAPAWLSVPDVRWFRLTADDVIVPVYDD